MQRGKSYRGFWGALTSVLRSLEGTSTGNVDISKSTLCVERMWIANGKCRGRNIGLGDENKSD